MVSCKLDKIAFQVYFAIFLHELFLVSVAAKLRNEHRTKEAVEKLHDLSCYRCDTMIDGDKCVKLNVSENNGTIFHHKCGREDKICKVKKISWSTSTEDMTGKPELWSLQRNCTSTCEEGCIIIGERTKLYSCTSCCNTNLCNLGSGAKEVTPFFLFSFMNKVIAFAALLDVLITVTT